MKKKKKKSIRQVHLSPEKPEQGFSGVWKCGKCGRQIATLARKTPTKIKCDECGETYKVRIVCKLTLTPKQ